MNQKKFNIQTCEKETIKKKLEIKPTCYIYNLFHHSLEKCSKQCATKKMPCQISSFMWHFLKKFHANIL